MISSPADSPIEPPPWLNAPPVDPYPFEESHDLRVGPPLHPALNALLPYIGQWRGRGRGVYSPARPSPPSSASVR